MSLSIFNDTIIQYRFLYEIEEKVFVKVLYNT